LPAAQRRRAVVIGLGAATVLRIVLAIFSVQLLHITGLAIAGGLLLLWVAWKMYQEIRARAHAKEAEQSAKTPRKKLSDAIVQILLADLGMSLDNILAVAGAARDHLVVLAAGLFLSVALMGLASTATAKLLHRWPWLGWLGIATVVYVAAKMIWDGFSVISYH